MLKLLLVSAGERSAKAKKQQKAAKQTLKAGVAKKPLKAKPKGIRIRRGLTVKAGPAESIRQEQARLARQHTKAAGVTGCQDSRFRQQDTSTTTRGRGRAEQNGPGRLGGSACKRGRLSCAARSRLAHAQGAQQLGVPPTPRTRSTASSQQLPACDAPGSAGQQRGRATRRQGLWRTQPASAVAQLPSCQRQCSPGRAFALQ